MPFSYTRPQFSLPFTIPAGTVTIDFTDLSSQVVNIASAVRYTVRELTDPSVCAWAYLASEMNGDDSGANNTWAASEVSGDYQGLMRLTCDRTAPGDTKTIQTITFSSTTLSNFFGCTTTTPNVIVVGNDEQYFQGTQMGYGLWIAHSGADCFLEINESTTEDAVVVTESPDGTSTIDDFGGVTRKEIVISQVPASMIWDYYAQGGEGSNSDWVDTYGGTQYDDQQAFDVFRQQWLLLSDSQSCRFFPDQSVLGQYTEINPGAADMWIARLSEAVERESRAPYRFRLTITANEV